MPALYKNISLRIAFGSGVTGLAWGREQGRAERRKEEGLQNARNCPHTSWERARACADRRRGRAGEAAPGTRRLLRCSRGPVRTDPCRARCMFPALTRSTSPMTDRSDGLLKSTRLLRAAHTKGKTCRLTGLKTAPGGQVLPGEWTLPPAPCSGQATMPPPHLTRPRHALAIAASGKLPSHHKCRVSVRPLRTAAAVTLTRTSSEVALCGCRLPRSKADK